MSGGEEPVALSMKRARDLGMGAMACVSGVMVESGSLNSQLNVSHDSNVSGDPAMDILSSLGGEVRLLMPHSSLEVGVYLAAICAEVPVPTLERLDGLHRIASAQIRKHTVMM